MILETERLAIRELDAARDAEFIFRLLNTPKFLKYIGDRGVRSVEDASVFIEDRYRASYREHGFGLYAVELKVDSLPERTLPTGRVSARVSIGMCGFVKRDSLPYADIGFAFLPEHEGKGYGFESANAMLDFGRDKLGFRQVLAITSLDNDVSGKLLDKLGFSFDCVITQNSEELNLYSKAL